MRNFVRPFVAVAFASSVISAFAQDLEGDDLADDLTAEESSSEKDESSDSGETLEVNVPQKIPERHFYTIVQCKVYDGLCEVMKPASAQWVPAEPGRFYPLGSTFRTVGESSVLTLRFGRECEVILSGNSSIVTRKQGLSEKTRSVILDSGTTTFKFPRNLPKGLFSVTSGGFTASNLAGESTIKYEKKGDGEEATIKCVTGEVTVEGRHFSVPSMRAADEFKIRSSKDYLFTGLYGLSGDILLKIDQGLVATRVYETAEDKIDHKWLDWKMTPQTSVRIHRAVPALGERMSVTVMTFDPKGELVNRCAFSEERVEVNSGEIGPISKIEKKQLEAVAKEAANSVTVEAAEETEEESVEEAPSDGSSSSSSSDDDFDF